MQKVAFACRSLGMSCEWAMQGATVEELLPRIVEHAKCAHKIPEVDAALKARILGAVTPA